MGKIYKNDVGVLIRLNTGVDVSGAASMAIFARIPNATEDITWAATADATPNYIKYLTASGDLVETGEYLLQSWVKWSDDSVHRGETYTLEVFEYFD